MSDATSPGSVDLLDSYTETSEILMPNDTNNLGRALGGSVLHWMDVTGAIAARRFARGQVVTAAMDHVDFTAAIDLGDIVNVEAYVFDTGATSMDVRVEVYAERPGSGKEELAASSFFTFVALDEAEEAPAPVPELETPTSAEEDLREAALAERRKRREELAESL